MNFCFQGDNMSDTKYQVMIMRDRKDFTANPIVVEEIERVHWNCQSSGYKVGQRGYSLYGYIPYTQAKELVSCSGRHGNYGNDVKIMIPKNLNKKEPYRSGYKKLLERRDLNTNIKLKDCKPCNSLPPLTIAIEKILIEQGPIERKKIREQLWDKGYIDKKIQATIRRLEKENRLICEGRTPNQVIRSGPENKLMKKLKIDSSK